MNIRIYFLGACLAVLVAADQANAQGFLKSLFGRNKASSTSSSTKLRGVLTTNSKERQGEDGFGSAEGAAFDDDEFSPPRDGEQDASSPGIFRRMTSGISNFFGRFVPFSRNSRRRPGLFGLRGKDQEDGDSPAEFFADFPTAADGPQIRNDGFADGVEPAGNKKRRRQQRRGNGQKRRNQQRRRQHRPKYEQEVDDYADGVDDYETGPSKPVNSYGQRPQQSDAQDDYSAPAAYPADNSNNNRQPESPASGGGAGFNDPYLSAPEESGSQQPQDFDQQRFGAPAGGASGSFSADTAFGALQGDNGSPFFGAGASASTNGNRGVTSGAGAAAGGSSSLLQSSASGRGDSRRKGAARKQGATAAAKPGADPADGNFPDDVERDFAAYGDKDEAFFEQKK